MLLYMCPHKKPRSADANLHTLRMPHARLPHTLRMRYLGRPTQTCGCLIRYAYATHALPQTCGSPRNTTSYICIPILLYMCPHTPIYVSSYHPAVPVSSYCYICVLILLCVSSYCFICALIFLYMCPHTAIYVSSYS